MDERSYSELLDLIYESAVEPQLWPLMMERLADSVGGTGAALIAQNQRSFEGVGLLARIDPSAVDSYFGHYAHLNPLLLKYVPNVQARAKTWAPDIFTDESQLPKSELMATEYYNDFLRPLDFHSILTISLHLRGLDGVLINLLRPARKDQFGAAELDFLGKLHPHLIRAYHLTVKLAGLRQLADGANEAMDRSPYGLVLADDSGRIRRMNPRAERLTRGGHGLLVRNGLLTATQSLDARRLEALIGAATSLDPERRSGGSMAVAAPTRRLPLSITVAPIRSERSPLFDEGPSALVCITDLEAGVSLPEHRLVDLLGLTPAEAKVALALLEGGGLREVSEGLGVSFYTVRAHLARIFEKTGTGRQAELVRLLMRMIGVDVA